MRGPGDDALVDGALEAEAGPPRSRTVVKPRISVAVGFDRRQEVEVADVASSIACAGVGRTSIVCQCMSISPGISVRPPPSMRCTVIPVGSAIGRARNASR